MPPQECQNQYLLDFIAEKSVRKTDQGWSWTFDPSTYDNLEVGNNQHETLMQLNCPVSFIYGENTMEFDTGNSIEEMKELLPEGSSVVALVDAQHHLMLDKPLEFVDELDKLIQGFF
jgi:pimeloyl-ACP methyl ester carboxylesterase